MTCLKCKQRGKTWDGDDPKCAFEDNKTTNKFSNKNWNCATMNLLRDLIERQSEKDKAYFYRDDTATGSIGILPFETNNFHGNLVLTWYKNRGQTGSAMVVCDDREPATLTLDIAEEILKHFSK